MLQYTLPLTISENPDQIPSQPSVTPSTIENNVEINQMMELMVNRDNINQQSTNIQNDHYHNYSLYQGDGDHLSQSSSTTNEDGQQDHNNDDNNIRSTPS
ncbi:unnamed protein product [Rotaria sp. Silwood2]|nr:unnamed protein product [Rotaria sp. Silwood2]CAF3524829.1 unnamed protein product [Rotaria sp. Silwood2]CAF4373949.1 unnamed protein product [Rotaria sp. Silwood2]CAF4509627.1 unnamed protein product [Rotaria sp. Silwood2]